MSEEKDLVPIDEEPAQEKLTPEQFVEKLQEEITRLELILDEHRTNLLNCYSIVVKELRAEAVEAAQALGRAPDKLFNRDTVYKNLNSVENEENYIFQTMNILIANQKKLSAFSKPPLTNSHPQLP